MCNIETLRLMSELLYKVMKPNEHIGTDPKQPVLRIPPKPL